MVLEKAVKRQYQEISLLMIKKVQHKRDFPFLPPKKALF